jgi:hypothetical protein
MGEVQHEEVKPEEVDLGEVGPPPRIESARVRPAFEELVRAGLALIFAGMLAATGGWAFIEIHSNDWVHVKSLLDILIPAESALLGSAVGFYFGTKK